MSDTRRQLIGDMIVTAQLTVKELRKVADNPELLAYELDVFEAQVALFNARHEFISVLEGDL